MFGSNLWSDVGSAFFTTTNLLLSAGRYAVDGLTQKTFYQKGVNKYYCHKTIANAMLRNLLLFLLFSTPCYG